MFLGTLKRNPLKSNSHINKLALTNVRNFINIKKLFNHFCFWL